MLDFIDGAYRCADVDQLARHVAKELLQLVPSDCTAYNEINLRRRRIVWVYDGVPPIADGERVFAAHMAEHPFIAHFEKAGSGPAVTIGDFLSARLWRQSGMYNEFYRPMGCEHVAGIALPTPPSLILGICAVRGGRDFSERDRRVLDVIRPHLVHAYDIATAASDRAAELALLADGIDAAGAAAVVLRADDGIRLATARARQLLHEYFDGGMDDGERLPEAVVAWLAAGEMPSADRNTPPPLRRPLVVARTRARLSIRLLERGAARILLLQEERTGLLPEDLAPLGVSAREAEVLLWLTLGKTDAEIGMILGISPRTVSHTVERVYRKLGVASRAAAAACALRVAHGRAARLGSSAHWPRAVRPDNPRRGGESDQP